MNVKQDKAEETKYGMAQAELAIREEMDLTDRFAIAAMGAYAYSGAEDSLQDEDVAVLSYALAQAMVLERAEIWREISERIHRARQANESQD